MPPTRKPRSPLADLAQNVWRLPFFAAAISLFFLLVNGAPLRQFGELMKVSLVFVSVTSLAVWGARHTIQPAMVRRFEGDPRLAWWIGGAHVVVATVASILAALLLHFTIRPGFLGNMRAVLTVLTYSVLFGTLFFGLAIAVISHRKALERAGSERELQLARRIQRSFLQSTFPRHPRLDVHAVNVSSKEVSGDFYDVVPIGADGVVLAIADVSGKGVPAALLSSMLQASLRTQAGSVASPARMISAINTLACDRGDTGQFATFFLAAFHAPTMELRFTNAGHNFPVLARAGRARALLETGGVVIGMMAGATYEEEAVRLAPGDRLLLYTDGVTEAANARGEMFGEERLYALIDRLPVELSAEQTVARVLDEVRGFLGDVEAGDDITVMAARVLDGASG